MSRLQRLKDATESLCDDSLTDERAISVVLLVLACIVHDIELDRICRLPCTIFAETLRERNAAFDRGDTQTIEAIKADVQATLDHIVERELDLISAFARDSITPVSDLPVN